MRIGIDAHFVGARHGGNEHHFENVIKALARDNSGGDELFAFSGGLRAKGVLPESVRLVALNRRSVYLQRALEIPRLARELRLDLIHVPFNVMPVGKAKKIVTIHDLAFLHVGDTFDFLERKRMSILTGLSARWADHIFTVSEYSRQDIVRSYRVPEKKVTVTPNAVDRTVFAPWDAGRKAAFLRTKGIDYPFLLFVGTFQPRKNVIRMLKAFASLEKSGPTGSIHLALVGRKGWLYDEIFSFLKEKGLQGRVHHFENADMDTLVGLYNTAQALVFPSLFEGFGMPILEAQSCGCPVLSSDVTSMPEICGDSALTFDPLDVPGMAARMDLVVRDGALRSDLTERGYRNCDRYAWENTAAVVRKAYHEL
jgi:glycosyltransferase involved in cell wall biosynthesis